MHSFAGTDGALARAYGVWDPMQAGFPGGGCARGGCIVGGVGGVGGCDGCDPPWLPWLSWETWLSWGRGCRGDVAVVADDGF